MLKTLFIENIAVVEQADITFDGGFNVLSGETGAGKSIVIDALGAILGGRVSREIIRTGESRAAVTAAFAALPPQAAAFAAAQGWLAEDGELVVRREIYADGRNTCKINGRPATLGMLKQLGPMLVGIHGQHDGQHLLNEALHVDYLDAFGQLEEQVAEYEGLYDRLLVLNRRVKALSMSAEERDRLRDKLTGQLEALEKADVRPGEQAELVERRLRLAQGERQAAALAAALAALDGQDDIPGAVARLWEGEKALRGVQGLDAQLAGFAAKLAEAAQMTADLSAGLSGLLLELDYSPALQEETESRLAVIDRLCQRHGVPADALEETAAQIAQELDGMTDAAADLEALGGQYVALRGQVAQAAEALHHARAEAAQAMRARVEAELHMLDMPSARFVAEIVSMLGQSQARFTRKGTDMVRFLLSANSGEELRPLSKVASGGELSRIMLALKTVMSRGEEGVTAVFDEIDAGVSGRAASLLGERLYAIARARQVLCVTHLPQIASMADHQFYIEKTSADGRTFTRITPLGREGRVRELARLAAGVHVTEATLKGAEQLLDSAEQAKRG